MKLATRLILVLGLLMPLTIFLNRFLIPDVAYDSINYHLFLGQRGVDFENNKFEFYPTGIHNFSTILEIPGYLLFKLLGYRTGTIGSLIFVYLSALIIYKIFRLYSPKFKILDSWWWGIIFVSSFLTFESFLQIAVYFTDIAVACLSLLSLYWLLKYEKFKIITDLYLSALVLGIVFLGKMTAGYFLLPYFGYLAMILIIDKKILWKWKIINFILAGVIVLAVSVPMWVKNYNNTGNPVFPYYNRIFKSEMFPMVNFTQDESGGDTAWEKIAWGVISATKPQMLGQAHDLFHDYKINIYFVLAIFILIWSIAKKEIQLRNLTIFYLLTFELWAWLFGYLRYGIFLEYWGGLILLIWFTKFHGVGKYLIIVPIVAILLLQNKRVINLSLAYDIAFRPGYYYNRISYPKELVNLNKNKIAIDNGLIQKYRPTVFLNCVSSELSYYVVSDFANLPVLNIDKEFYAGMTENKLYVDKSSELMKKKVGEKSVKFVTIAASTGLNTTYDQCLKNLKSRNFQINEVVDTDFLGYQPQHLKVIFGEFTW